MLYLILSLIGVTLFIPNIYWGRMLDKALKTISHLYSQFPQTLVQKGQSLIEFFSYSNLNQYQTQTKLNIPDYKYFTELLYEIYNARRVYGAEIQNIIFNIKTDIVKDVQFEKELRAQVINAWIQFFTMAILTWGFILLTVNLTGHKPQVVVLFTIVFLQIIGTIIFSYAYQVIKKKMMSDVAQFDSPIYGLSSLMNIGLPLSQVCEKVKVEQLWNLKDKELVVLVKRLFFAIENLKNTGAPITKLLEEIKNEVHFVRDQKFQKFLAMMAFIKFLVLAVFFLSSYFIFIISLFSVMMGEL